MTQYLAKLRQTARRADTGSLRQVVDGYFDALVFQELSGN